MSNTAQTHPVPREHAETARVRKQDTSHPCALTANDIDSLLTAVHEQAMAIRDTLAERADRTERITTERGEAVVYLGPDVLETVLDAMDLGDCVRRSMARVAHTETAAAHLDVADEAVVVAPPR
ncbi:hypothetical protein ACFR9U_11955 [Halorientalis brevis]|uniref:Uncharacterized protein n=1 Tax=Halorientalis brevis TaxID=1126241 RepID=A0ABD6CCX3_9EURY|nr:hypothetical protein [Halorientalis brevis]